MNFYKTYCLIFFLFLANGFEATANNRKFVKIGMNYILQDTIPKQRTSKNNDRDKTQVKDAEVVKSVPRARRQVKPKVVRPNIEAVKTVRPKIRAKVITPVRIKV